MIKSGIDQLAQALHTMSVQASTEAMDSSTNPFVSQRAPSTGSTSGLSDLSHEKRVHSESLRSLEAQLPAIDRPVRAGPILSKRGEARVREFHSSLSASTKVCWSRRLEDDPCCLRLNAVCIGGWREGACAAAGEADGAAEEESCGQAFPEAHARAEHEAAECRARPGPRGDRDSRAEGRGGRGV